MTLFNFSIFKNVVQINILTDFSIINKSNQKIHANKSFSILSLTEEELDIDKVF